MRLRDALDLCTDTHSDDWARIPGGRPATTFLAGMFDPGAAEPRLTPLTGHTIAVYEPDPRLSLLWPVPDDDERDRRERNTPEWLTDDSHDWNSARDGWVVILLNGAPVWQELVWYLDWGSGVGGYVANFQARFGQGEGVSGPSTQGWEVSAWEVGLARLLNVFSGSGDFGGFDPTPRVVPSPLLVHPVDAELGSY